MATRAASPSDLTDKQWAEIAPHIPVAEPGGGDREVDRREVLNGILYLLRGGICWRMLPHDLPPWGTVPLLLPALSLGWHVGEDPRHPARPSQKEGRAQGQSLGGDHGQPVGKNDQKGGPCRGYDAGKGVSGRKRHILVDTMGLLYSWWSSTPLT